MEPDHQTPSRPLNMGPFLSAYRALLACRRTVRLRAFDPVDARRAARGLSWGDGLGCVPLRSPAGDHPLGFPPRFAQRRLKGG